jgi:hypothetical protein
MKGYYGTEALKVRKDIEKGWAMRTLNRKRRECRAWRCREYAILTNAVQEWKGGRVTLMTESRQEAQVQKKAGLSLQSARWVPRTFHHQGVQ